MKTIKELEAVKKSKGEHEKTYGCLSYDIELLNERIKSLKDVLGLLKDAKDSGLINNYIYQELKQKIQG